MWCTIVITDKLKEVKVMNGSFTQKPVRHFGQVDRDL